MMIYLVLSVMHHNALRLQGPSVFALFAIAHAEHQNTKNITHVNNDACRRVLWLESQANLMMTVRSRKPAHSVQHTESELEHRGRECGGHDCYISVILLLLTNYLYHVWRHHLSGLAHTSSPLLLLLLISHHVVMMLRDTQQQNTVAQHSSKQCACEQEASRHVIRTCLNTVLMVDSR